MITNGYIRLSRELLNWQWYGNSSVLSLYIHLLLSANYDTAQWQGMEIHRGQRAVSIGTLALETGSSKSTVCRIIKKLEGSGDITRAVRNNITILTITNYDRFVSVENPVSSSNSERNDLVSSSFHDRSISVPNGINKKYNKRNNFRAREKNISSHTPTFTIEMLEQSAYARYKKKSAD